ncbi:unnamed protein product [Phytophthora lilii]|uniref:Unnamed protein product n=1 Tax=Phytophthora lilii TaxID=2077276 RepID=A0A9W7D9Z8_9STRA|nr:unnamed protein product [Phytophthora lilii]
MSFEDGAAQQELLKMAFKNAQHLSDTEFCSAVLAGLLWKWARNGDKSIRESLVDKLQKLDISFLGPKTALAFPALQPAHVAALCVAHHPPHHPFRRHPHRSCSPVTGHGHCSNRAMVAFWACEVTETKAAAVDVPAGFVLNVVNATSGAAADAQLVLGLETQQLDGQSWKGVVAHLGAEQPLQVKLDLVFGRKVKFYVAKGAGAVNLTGYFQPGPELDLMQEEARDAAKKSKKRAREEKKAQTSWDEVSSHTDRDLMSLPICCLRAGVSLSSSESEEVPEKKAKAAKPATTTPPAKKEEQKKPKQTETSSNTAAPAGTSQKKKRKKNKHKKQAAANGDAK